MTANPVAEFELTPEERSEARTHWLALMPAPTPEHLEEARNALKAAPRRI